MKQIPANYREAVDYIEELPKFTEKHPLKHTKKYLKKLQKIMDMKYIRIENVVLHCAVIYLSNIQLKKTLCRCSFK